ncbi:hypothetical protein RCL_jg6284.t1 [Rhizophagus clarus]|uniref:Uncharacterized protein n=1 Tax=Rhizophagus clarus TaxID=94130 RepID=A0A8H3L4V0_9GLOM|nr:hypothetical protein RCL_jg6284.t1 [Rhizophagus clarus]
MTSDPKALYFCEKLAQLPSEHHQIFLSEFANELEDVINANIKEIPEGLFGQPQEIQMSFFAQAYRNSSNPELPAF